IKSRNYKIIFYKNMTTETKKFESFEDFTNLYEISKTIQFNLVPLKWDSERKNIAEDKEFAEFKKHGIIEKDEQTSKNIKTTKFYLDILHGEFIEEALKELRFKKEDLEKIYFLSQKLEENKRDKQVNKEEGKKKYGEFKKQLSIARDNLLEELKNIFILTNQRYKLKNKYPSTNENDKNILLSKHVLELLRKRFTKEEIDKLRKNNQDSSIVYPDVEDGKGKSVFNMNAGFLDDFHKNREHSLYSVKGKKGSFGGRILDNFEIFNQNKKIFEEKYKKSDIDFSEVEKSFGRNLNDVFGFDFYNGCISQNGIDCYNKILGGESHKEERKKTRGLNEIINLYAQKKEQDYKEQKKEGNQQKAKFSRKNYPTLMPLQKRVLSKILKKEILIEGDTDLICELNDFIKKSEGKVEKARTMIDLLCSYKKNHFDLTKIYLPKSKINSFAYKVFKEPQEFMAVYRDGRKNLGLIDFGKIKDYLNGNKLEYKDFFKPLAQGESGFDAFLCIWKHEFGILISGGETIVKGGQKEKVINLDIKKSELEKWLKWFKDKVAKNEKMTDKDEGMWCSAVLDYSQTILDITKRAEIFWLNEKQEIKVSDSKDGVFYSWFNEFIDDGFTPFIYFDKFRNYLNKRSKNTAKGFRLYFNTDHLLDGWDMNKEPQYRGFLLRKGNDYYLGIGNENGKIFHKLKSGSNLVEEVPEAYTVKDGDDYYEKIDYKQLDIGKFEGIAFPKKTNSEENYQKALKKRADEFLNGNISKLQKLIETKKEYDDFKVKRQKDKAWDRRFDTKKMKELISYYITCLNTRKEWKRFNFEFKKPEEYNDKPDFVNHLQRQAYWINPKRVSKKYVDEKVAQGEMFLFKIHSKDFYDFEKKLSNNNPYRLDKKPSKTNLFTQYFLELFSDENIRNIKSKDLNKSIFELDGKAELRFRRKTDNVKLKFYKKNGKIITCANKKDGNMEKEVIEHRRFTKDVITLHLKIRLNFGKEIEPQEFNKIVNTKLSVKESIEILGIDRGENNLVYYCLLNEEGEIKECASLNKVGERIRKLGDGTCIKEPVDYYQKLVEREQQRDWEQKNWQKITPIKDLKRGYLANVINEITKIVFANIEKGVATIIALEDLGQNFKRTRFFRERQVYQEFEKDLISKLNYLVDKNKKNYRKAYQFTFKVDSVQDMEKKKQIGNLFYVGASYTSKICPSPTCGWRKRLYIKNSETKGKIVKALESIKIFYEKEKDRFRFDYQWEQKYKKEGKEKKYGDIDTVFSSVSRLRYDRGKNKTEPYKDKTENSVTNKIKDLFKNRINIIQDANITEKIIKKEKELDAGFFHDLINYFNLILQIRNYDKENGDDYIQCPYCGFDSRNSKVDSEQLREIANGDANGAYNIARKGLMLLKRIKANPEKPNLIISSKDWDEVVSEWDK
ncbi:hypothetical protein CO122_01595, partial [bacterium (Candidatus Gribaldobacteria) CG_4_9_14_3_um_filter_33_9]